MSKINFAKQALNITLLAMLLTVNQALAEITVADQDDPTVSRMPLRWFSFDQPKDEDRRLLPLQQFNNDTQTVRYYLPPRHKRKNQFNKICEAHGLTYGGWVGALYVLGNNNFYHTGVELEEEPDLSFGIHEGLAVKLRTNLKNGNEWPGSLINALIYSDYQFKGVRQVTPYAFASARFPLNTLRDIDRQDKSAVLMLNVHQPTNPKKGPLTTHLTVVEKRNHMCSSFTRSVLDVNKGITIDTNGAHRLAQGWRNAGYKCVNGPGYRYDFARGNVKVNATSQTELLVGCH